MELVYKLFAAKPTQENIKRAMSERFFLITPEYILIYNQSKRIKGWIEIKGEKMALLKAADTNWLYDNNITILTEFAEKEKKALQTGMNQMTDKFRTELETEKKRLETGATGDGQ